jgi:hypothetical protein
VSASGDGFLSRWSRRKRDVAADEAAKVPAAVVPAAPAPGEPPLPEGKTLEELVAELPRVDELVPGQSLTAFMQAWVPTPIRNAALQRMWLLDPAIRDYVNPALDYAYDYNTPGGAPGFGTMETSEEAVREVAEMFDRALGRDPEPTNDADACDGTPQDALGDDVAPQPERAAALSSIPTAAPEPIRRDTEEAAGTFLPEHAAMRETAAEPARIQPLRVRKGGALPR